MRGMRTGSRSVGAGPAAVVWFVAAGLVVSCAPAVGSAGRSVVTPEASGTSGGASPGPTVTAAPDRPTPGPSLAAATPTARASARASAATEPFRLSAAAFVAGGAIPRAYTCDGADESPALAWSGAPAGTAALVLLVEDPDARNFVHWIVLDLPGAAAGSLPRAVASGAATPRQGRNDFGRVGWGGPCPPSGTHHYRFTLSALGAPLGLSGHPNGTEVRAALGKASVLGRAILEATYKRG